MSECKPRSTWTSRLLSLAALAVVALLGVLAYLAVVESDRQKKQEYHRAARWEMAVDALGNGVLLADENGIIFDVNESLRHMTGWGSEELIGQPIDIIMSANERQYHKKGFENLEARRALAEGETLIIDGCHVRMKSGRTMKVRTRIQGSRGLDDSMIYVSTITPWGKVRIIEYKER